MFDEKRKSSQVYRNKRGFTLIELLVVLAIMSLLLRKPLVRRNSSSMAV